jgi:hypothetical protein
MPRKAATKSCSTMTSAPVAESSAWAGETVPQNGQISAFLAGFHCDSPPQDGQENFFWAVASGILLQTIVMHFHSATGQGALVAVDCRLYELILAHSKKH